MTDEMKSVYLERMTENMPVLRAKLGVTQTELAKIAGISRQTILSIEKRQHPMTWNMFLALVFVFSANEKTKPLVDLFQICDEELIANIISNTKK